MKTITVRANEVSQPYYAGAGSRITLTGSGRVEWAAVEKLQDALNGATWNTWPAGSTAGYRDTERGLAVRVVGTGACTVTIEEGKGDPANEGAYWQPVGDGVSAITNTLTGGSVIVGPNSTLELPPGDNTLSSGGGADVSAVTARVDALETVNLAGLSLVGGWSAAGGTFPSGSTAGGYYIVTTAGTVNSVVFAKGDLLVPLVSAASTTTYAANWLRLDESAVSVATSAIYTSDHQRFATKKYTERFSLLDIASQTVTSGGTPSATRTKVAGGLQIALTSGGPFTWSSAMSVGAGITRLTYSAKMTFTATMQAGFAVYNGTDRYSIMMQSNGWMIWANTRGGGFYSTVIPALTSGDTVTIVATIDGAAGVMQAEVSVNGGAPYIWRFSDVFPGAVEMSQKAASTVVHAFDIETLGQFESQYVSAAAAAAIARQAGAVAAAERMLGTMRRTPPGSLVLPSGYEAYHNAGSYWSNIELQPILLDGDPMVTTLYVDIATGADTNKGTSTSPLKSLYAAQVRVQAGANVIIKAKGGTYDYANAFRMGVPQCKLQVMSWDGVKVISSRHTAGLTWALDTGTTYSTTISETASSVFDSSRLTADGDFTRLAPAASLTACRATADSWFVSGSTIYVTIAGGRAPDADIRVYRVSSDTSNAYGLKINAGSTVFLQDVEIHGGTTAIWLDSNSSPTTTINFYAKRSGVKYTSLGGYQFKSGGLSVLQSFTSAWCDGDGANVGVNAFGGESPFAIEIDCQMRWNGFSNSGSINGSSGHGARVLRVGGDYHHNKDRSIHDIDENGHVCQSWNLGVTSRDSQDNEANFAVGISGGTDVGHMWLDGCTSSGSTGGVVSYAATTLHTYNLTTDAGASGNVVSYVP